MRRPLATYQVSDRRSPWYKAYLASGRPREGNGVTVGDLVVPTTAQLAAAIADSFYGDGLDLSARENPAAGTWSEMPEVGAVQRLRDLHASDRQVRLFLTFVALRK